MKTLRLMTLLRWGVLFLLTMPVFLQAQITFTANDLLGHIGSRHVLLEDRRFSIPVNVGMPGANRIWDFRGQIIGDSVFAVQEYFAPSMFANSANYMNANLVVKITSPEDLGFELFQFYQITSDFFIDRGDSAKFTGGGLDTTFVSFEDDTASSLPISFNDSWMTADADTSGIYPAFATITIDTTFNTIDGWGTIRLPLGDFECLRLRADETTISQTIVNGVVINSGTESDIQYNWFGKNTFQLANAQSQPGETNPNFTDARGFGRLDSLKMSPSTGVADASETPAGFQLSQNYPNPFNPSTAISYQLLAVSNVSLKVFDQLGREIVELVHKNQPAGNYSVNWDGRDKGGNIVASGLYIYTLKAGATTQTRKMLFIQ